MDGVRGLQETISDDHLARVPWCLMVRTYLTLLIFLGMCQTMSYVPIPISKLNLLGIFVKEVKGTHADSSSLSSILYPPLQLLLPSDKGLRLLREIRVRYYCH